MEAGTGGGGVLAPIWAGSAPAKGGRASSAVQASPGHDVVATATPGWAPKGAQEAPAPRGRPLEGRLRVAMMKKKLLELCIAYYTGSPRFRFRFQLSYPMAVSG